MFSFFQEQRKAIIEELESILEIEEKDSAFTGELGRDAFKILKDFTAQGKMIRGGLIPLAYSFYDRKIPRGAYVLAATVELFQSAFLIHDDIMDNDYFRRGNPSVFHQYEEKGKSQGFSHPKHYGRSMGICLGDVAIFSGFGKESLLDDVDPGTYIRIFRLMTKEYMRVGMAQMFEMHLSCLETATEEEILSVYLYKTGRYTFSLPLMLGAILAGQPQEEVERLSELGEYLGIIFQLKDDELGMMGTSEEIGKMAGSDIQESKKTLYYIHLYNRASEEDRSRLDQIFGKKDLTPEDLDFVQELIHKLGIQDHITGIISGFEKKAEALVQSLAIKNEKYREVLEQLLAYNLNRRK